MNEKKIAPHIPVIDKSGRDDGSFSRQHFTFDKQHNVYVCPQGKVLRTTGRHPRLTYITLSGEDLKPWSSPAEADMLSEGTPTQNPTQYPAQRSRCRQSTGRHPCVPTVAP